MAYINDPNASFCMPNNNYMTHSPRNSRDMADANTSFIARTESAASSHYTPPDTPADDEVDVSTLEYPQIIFHNFLRTVYPFQEVASDSSVTLNLNHGDIVMVHSIHTNGWADGTLLNTGERGWIPTNYCESYNEDLIKNLLQALLRFVSLLQSGPTTDDWMYSGTAHMQGMLAGVRYLLEKSNCLNRNSPMILGNSTLRRNRRVLCNELSTLVKTGKALETLYNSTFRLENEPLSHDAVDDMVLQAFRIVTRGVKFLDSYLDDPRVEQCGERPASRPGPALPEPQNPLSAPVERTSSPTVAHAEDAASRRVSMASHTRNVSDAHNADQAKRLSYKRTSTVFSPALNSTSVRHSSIQMRRLALSPEPAQDAKQINRENYVSERITDAHDAFKNDLKILMSRLNISSTQGLYSDVCQVIESGKNLLEVIEALCNHDPCTESELQETRDKMYTSIEQLVRAGNQCPRHSMGDDEDDIMMPEDFEFIKLTATELVAVSGDCVGKARTAIDVIGDIELGPVANAPYTAASSFGSDRTEAFDVPSNEPSAAEDLSSSPPQPETRPPPPPFASEYEDKPLPAPPTLAADRIDPGVTMILTPQAAPHLVADATEAVDVTMIRLDSPVDPMISEDAVLTPRASEDTTAPSSIIQDFDFGQSFGHAFSQSFSGSEHSISPRASVQSSIHRNHSLAKRSSTTYLSSMRDSEQSLVSQVSFTSTRATTPDLAPFTAGHKSSHSSAGSSLKSHNTLDNDATETEDKLLVKSYAHELTFNKEGQIAGGSLNALIERMTTHESTPDAIFVASFYLTFRLFATPEEFAQALIHRFDYVSDKVYEVHPARYRVSNVFKGWLETHWRHMQDDTALPLIRSFAQDKLSLVLPKEGKRLISLCDKVASTDAALVPRLVSSMGKTNVAAAIYIPTDTPLPPSELGSEHYEILRDWKAGIAAPEFHDFPPKELARQLSIKAMKIFGNIMPYELLGSEWTKKKGSIATNVKAMSTMVNDISAFVTDSILEEGSTPKSRALVIKKWIEVANECWGLHNYDSLTAIIIALSGSSISRLKKSWALVPKAIMDCFEEMNEMISPQKNYSGMRARLQEVIPPCLPFVGTYLTDLIFNDEGNPATKHSNGLELINFAKHTLTAKIIGELQRFQIPYRLTEEPEMQEWIQSVMIVEHRAKRESGENDDANRQYAMSLKLEPRVAGGAAVRPGLKGSESSANLMEKFSWKVNREKLHQLTTVKTNRSH